MKIGLLGHGVVGTGVDRIIEKLPDIEVRRVMSLIIDDDIKDRYAASIDEIVNDPEIDTVVEVMGGTEPAFTFVKKALEAGKNVVTSNKALVAKYYDELITLSEQHHTAFRSTAAVGGGIPWLPALERAKRVDSIRMIGGIMNGTTNFILDKMTRFGCDFDTVLKEAQDLGYAERDPSADIDGLDVRRKITISSNVAFGVQIDEEAVPTFGIRSVTLKDIEEAGRRGAHIKLLAYGKQDETGVTAFVEPAFVKDADPIANIPENYNLIYYMTDNAGKQEFIGEGAGRFPTAFNVVEDCVDILHGAKAFYTSARKKAALSGNVTRSYYVRTVSPDDQLLKITKEVSGNTYITEPVNVYEMHAWAENKRKTDASLFIAGIL